MNPSLTKEITSSPANPLHPPIYSSSLSVHHILTLLVTLSSPFPSSIISITPSIYFFWVSHCADSFVFFIVLSPWHLLSVNLSCTLSSISCSVLHRQFTKSGIPSLFSPEAFNTIFNTKTPKVER